MDLICAFATDGRIEGFALVILRDDREFFPPYEAAPVAREDILGEIPGLAPLLQSLQGKIDGETMRALNHRVDILQGEPAMVAAHFLREHGFIAKGSPEGDLSGKSKHEHLNRE